MAQKQVEAAGNVATELSSLIWQSLRLGPWLNYQMTAAAAPYLLQGIGPAGAQATAKGVDTGNAKALADLVVTMVHLGLAERLVVPIVVSLVAVKREDAVTAITLELISAGRVTEVTAINNALLAGGYETEAGYVTYDLVTNQAQNLVENVQEAAGNLWQSLGGGEDSKQNASKLQENEVKAKGNSEAA